jgi:hypothetical protein
MSIAKAARFFLNVATLAASVALPLYMAMNYPLNPFACSIKWVTGWFHWSQQSLIICITCNILSSHKASHLTHFSEIWRKLHKNDSQLQVSPVITFWVLLTKYEIMNGNHSLFTTSTLQPQW